MLEVSHGSIKFSSFAVITVLQIARKTNGISPLHLFLLDRFGALAALNLANLPRILMFLDLKLVAVGALSTVTAQIEITVL